MKIKPVLLFAASVAFAVAPLVTPPFTGYEAGRFPVEIPRPSIQPAGYAFSIWGPIYLWLLIHAVFGLARRSDDPAWDVPRLSLSLSLVLGAAWLSIAGVAPVLATVVIWMMLAAALWAFLATDTHTDRWLLSAPLAIYAGWLSAAAAVSLGVVLAGYGWLGDTASAVVMLGLVLAIAVAVQMRKSAMPLYGLTVIWALAGVVFANAGPNVTVAVIAASGAVILVLTLLATRRKA